MRCASCQFDNEAGAQFCVNCGKPIQTVPPRPNIPPLSNTPSSGFRCPKCGSLNAADNTFCENCGSSLSSQSVQSTFSPPTYKTEAAVQKTGKTSGAWWILPILLGLMGGLVAWIVVREADKSKAKSMLVVGIVMTFVWFLVGIALSVLGYFIQI
jgi:uncharacterized membrane protein YvbJ